MPLRHTPVRTRRRGTGHAMQQTRYSPTSAHLGRGAESGSTTGSRPSEALGANRSPGRKQARRPPLGPGARATDLAGTRSPDRGGS